MLSLGSKIDVSVSGLPLGQVAAHFNHIEHRYVDAVDHNWLGHHDPEGHWLYGEDIGILPEYRRRGCAIPSTAKRRG